MFPQLQSRSSTIQYIYVFGIQRSGNHAIIDWIKSNIDLPIVHFNGMNSIEQDVILEADSIAIHGLNGFFFGKDDIVSRLKYLIRYHSRLKEPQIVSQLKHWAGGRIPIRDIFRQCFQSRAGFGAAFSLTKNHLTLQRRPFVDLSKLLTIETPHCRIESYENLTIDNARRAIDRSMSSVHESTPSRNIIVVFRDPYNVLASVYQRGWLSERRASFFVDLCKTYTKEFIGVSHLMPEPCIHVFYDKWVISPEYRQGILARIGLPRRVIDVETMARQGGGSSFEGVVLTRESPTRFITRWKRFQDDPFFQSKVLGDPELKELREAVSELGRFELGHM